MGLLNRSALFALGWAATLGCATTGGGAPAEPLVPYDLAAAQARGLAPVEARAEADAPAVLLSDAKVMTAAGAIYDPGFVVLEGGRILVVGEGIAPPDFYPAAQRISLPGHVITPGLIDTHSHLGVYPSPNAHAHSDGNEATAPLTAGVWAEHSVWPQDPGLELAAKGGVTSLQALPGSANLVGGRGVVLHNVPHRGARAMRFEGAPETVKFACGENPKRVYGDANQAPSTRMGNLRAFREGFLDAEAYAAEWEGYDLALNSYAEQGGKAPTAPVRDLDLETLVGVLAGEILPQVHCYRADDMLSVLQVADEFGFEVRAFHHALEAYKIRDILAERGVGVATWADWWGFKLEAYDGIPYNAALVSTAGGIANIHSDSEIGIQRLNQEAGKALAAGLQAGLPLTEDEALRWITYNAAWILGIEGEVGSLEAGKRADVVVWDGSPFSVYSRPRYVFIDGALRVDADHPGPPWSDYMLGQEVQP